MKKIVRFLSLSLKDIFWYPHFLVLFLFEKCQELHLEVVFENIKFEVSDGAVKKPNLLGATLVADIKWQKLDNWKKALNAFSWGNNTFILVKQGPKILLVLDTLH